MTNAKTASAVAKEGAMRRNLLKAGLAASPRGPPWSGGAAARPYRVAVIGHTGRGNYGHGLDEVWLETPGVRIEAVADADPQGLAARSSGSRGRRLSRLPPNARRGEARPGDHLPAWLDQHCDMVVAAAERGVRGIYMEKPMRRTLAEADAMVAACEKHKVKFAIAFRPATARSCPWSRS